MQLPPRAPTGRTRHGSRKRGSSPELGVRTNNSIDETRNARTLSQSGSGGNNVPLLNNTAQELLAFSSFLGERSFSGAERRSKKSSVASLGQMLEQPVIDVKIKGRGGLSNPEIKLSPRGGTGTGGSLELSREFQVAL